MSPGVDSASNEYQESYGGKERSVRKDDNLNIICEPIV
jgi:hypothetical protein